MSVKAVADIALCVLALGQFGFTAQYILRSPWWSTEIGKIYALKSVLWTLVVLQVSASVLTESEYPGRQYFRIAIYIGGALAVVVLWWMLGRIQGEGRKARAEHGDVRTQRRVWADALREWAGRG
ncbi:putative phage holin [Gordonia rubripertincta]|uniref:putative phage holin n=1 Tax=Gordonia rubripertincta TaxID=36822 RepID=UPI001FD39D17|nr:hypothetical protein [Gordonia rubripertincta]